MISEKICEKWRISVCLRFRSGHQRDSELVESAFSSLSSGCAVHRYQTGPGEPSISANNRGMASPPSPLKQPSRITIPLKANPLAKLVFGEMAKQGVTYDELEWRAGVLKTTIKAWRSENSPGLLSIEAALGALGWSLVPVPMHKRLPPNIAAGLDALNAEWAGEEPILHHLLASACLAPLTVTFCNAPAPAARRLRPCKPAKPGAPMTLEQLSAKAGTHLSRARVQEAKGAAQ